MPGPLSGAVDYPTMGRGVFRKSTSRTAVGTSPRCGRCFNGRKRGQPGGALATRGLVHGDFRIVLVANNTGDYLATLLAALAIGAVVRVAPPPTPSREGGCATSSGSDPVSSHRKWCTPARTRCRTVPWCAEELQTLPGFSIPGPARSRRRPPYSSQGSTSAPRRSSLSAWQRGAQHCYGQSRDGDGSRWRPIVQLAADVPRHGLHPSTGRADLRRSHRTDDPVPGFLRDPLSWVRNMTHHRSSVTAGPTFALPRCGRFLERSSGARTV